MTLTIDDIRRSVKSFNEKSLFDCEKAGPLEIRNKFIPPEDSFELVQSINTDKRYVMPAQSVYGLQLFRGQAKDFPTCFPSIYRNRENPDGTQRQPTKIEIFVDWMKVVEFELMLKSHFLVSKWFEPQNINVDYVGLAQHYGLRTDVLDFTADIEVALFFAICRYVHETDTYRLPDAQEISEEGIIYVLSPTRYCRNFTSVY